MRSVVTAWFYIGAGYVTKMVKQAVMRCQRSEPPPSAFSSAPDRAATHFADASNHRGAAPFSRC